MKYSKTLLLGMCLAGLPCATLASPLVYTPVNPNFGGSPFNGSNLMAEANAQNQYTAKKDPGQTTEDLLRQQAESTLVGSAVSAVFQDAQAGGTGSVVINGLIISFHPDPSAPGIEVITIQEPNGGIITLQTGIHP